jgi:hypothetical protein
MPLKALGLRTGMALQTRRLVEGASKKESQFFGAIESRGVMVGPMGPDGMKTELEEGEVCVVRGFTGQYEFSFLSKVLQTFQQPFAYALLAYPAQGDATLVRHSMRTKTTWPTTVLVQGKDGQPASEPLDATLVDISMQGAMFKVDTPLASVGDLVTLGIAVSFDDAPVQLSLAASICHNNRVGSDLAFCIGVAFKNLTQYDKLVLHYVTQADLEQAVSLCSSQHGGHGVVFGLGVGSHMNFGLQGLACGCLQQQIQRSTISHRNAIPQQLVDGRYVQANHHWLGCVGWRQTAGQVHAHRMQLDRNRDDEHHQQHEQHIDERCRIHAGRCMGFVALVVFKFNGHRVQCSG